LLLDDMSEQRFILGNQVGGLHYASLDGFAKGGPHLVDLMGEALSDDAHELHALPGGVFIVEGFVPLGAGFECTGLIEYSLPVAHEFLLL
jgi:hypothetical protein